MDYVFVTICAVHNASMRHRMSASTTLPADHYVADYHRCLIRGGETKDLYLEQFRLENKRRCKDSSIHQLCFLGCLLSDY